VAVEAEDGLAELPASPNDVAIDEVDIQVQSLDLEYPSAA